VTVHARPEPDPKHPGADLTALGAEIKASSERVHSAFREQLQRQDTNPDLIPVVLTAGQPIAVDRQGATSLSIGVLNPSDVVIYWGIGGARAEPDGRSIAQPARSLMVLPLRAQDLALGADPADLAAGDVVLQLMRFATVQPCMLGGVA